MTPSAHGPSATPPAGDVKRRAVKSFVWAAVSFGGNKLLVLAATLVLAYPLDPRDFGVVAAGFAFASYLEVILGAGVTSAIVYEQEEGVTDRVHTAFTLNLLVCLVLAATGVLAAPAVARLFGVPSEAGIFRVLSLALLIRGPVQINQALLRRDLRFRTATAADLARAGVRAAVSIVLAFAGFKAWAVVWGFVAGETVGACVLWAVAPFRPRLLLDPAARRTLLRFGSAIVLLDILAELGLNADYVVVGNRLGAAALGLYMMGFRLPELLIGNVFWVFSNVAFPVFAKARTLGTEVFRDAMLRTLRITTLFGFSVGAGLSLVARDAIHLLPPKWWAAAGPMTVLAISSGLGSTGYASGDIFKAAGRPGLLLQVNAVGTVVLVAGFVLAAPHGITAVAWVHAAFNLAYAVVRLALASRFVDATFDDNAVAMRPALCVAAGITAFALPVRLLTHAGPAALVGIVVAGTAGAVMGLALGGRDAVGDVRELVGQALSRGAP